MNRIVDVSFGSLKSTDQLVNPLLHRLYGDWCSAALPCGLPDHAIADPLKLSYLLGHLLVIGVVRGPGGGMRFQYRLIGTKVVARWRKDLTSKWMDEHEDHEIARTGPPACQMAVDTRKPVHVNAKRHLEGKFYPVEYLLLPIVGEDLETIDRLLIAQVYPPETPYVPYGTG